MDNVETSVVTLTVGDGSNTTSVTTTGDESQVADLELDVVRDLSRVNVKLDGVVDLDEGVGVTDGATVVGDNERNTLGTKLETADLAELVLGLLRGDTVNRKAALGVVYQTEVLVGLLDGDDVCARNIVSPLASSPVIANYGRSTFNIPMNPAG